MASAEKLSTDKAEDTNTLTKRETKFSEKGHVHFEETCMKYKKPLFRSWKVIEDFILSIQQTDKNIDHYRELESQINSAFSDYQRHTEDYLSFLRQYNSELTRNERQRCADDFDKGKSVVQKALNNIKKLKLDLLDSVSNVSISSSEKKRRGERKLELMKKEAELKKEKLRLEVEESIQKAERKRKKEELEIDLKLLKQESIIEAASDEESVEDLQLDEETSSQRASKYVSSLPDEIPSEIPNQPNVDSSKQKTVHAVGSDSQTMMSEMSLFLMRKQLLPEHFSNFEDTPESYTAWKSSFKNIIGVLKTSAYEELELLINKLTGNSKQAASGIRNANPGKPKHALGLIWERLDHMYGRPEMVEASIRQQLENFQPVKSGENKRLYDLLNILIKIESLMTNSVFASSLAYFNSSTGVNPIITKLPFNLQEKWITRASTYKKTNSVPFPPFTYFVAFIREISEVRNDPAFSFINSRQSTVNKRQVHAKKSDITNSVSHFQIRCPYHKANHSIHDCKAFRAKPLTERRNFLQSKNICTRCCVSARHCARDYQVNIQCKTCGSNNHATALHLDKASSASASVHGGEGIRNSFAQPKASGHGKENLPPLPKESKDTDSFVTSMCTTFCGDIFQGRSCSKTFLVDVYHHDNPNNVLRVYAIVDDQCNQTLASPELLDTLDTSSIPTKFTLATCSGKTAMYGRNVLGLKVRSIDRTITLDLPSVLECEDIPNDMSEIPTPEIAKSYTHLSVIASKIPEFDPNSKIHLLIGRDLLEAHHIKEQILGPRGAPFAQRLAQKILYASLFPLRGFGWVIIGEVCHGKIHQRTSLNVKKVSILNDGRVTCNEPCPNYMLVKKQISSDYKDSNRDFQFHGDDVFLKTPEDDRIGLSVEDRQFLKLMGRSFTKNSEGLWTAPLPFRQSPVNMPNNRSQAVHRAQILHISLQRDSVKKEQFVKFMDKVLKSGAAEVAPNSTSTACWYLPLFGVRNPKKPNQIRGVFDSSAKYGGVSLNSMLMTGPDMINSLLGILLRFRQDEVAMTTDIEQMFYRFRVDENHRDFLRFLWYRDNNPEEDLIEHKMTSHVFGNSPSPAVACYGLLKTVENADPDVKNFVKHNFYVDDGLISLTSESDAIGLMKRTQDIMKTEGQIRLHKITSNRAAVMEAFDISDRGEEVKEIDNDHLVHRSLGLCWNLKEDTFVFTVPKDEKPFTRRGLLSTVNSLFDPIGFIAPITISGKILLRECTPEGIDWDEPLPTDHLHKWKEWQSSIDCLSDIAIPRMLSHTSGSLVKVSEVHIFSDASEKAIAASAYLKTVDNDGLTSVRFIIGKGKLAPLKGITVPRLELCGAVLASEIAEIISVQLHIPLSSMKFYTDSRVVLGYINNHTRRFYTYVSNRVDRILRISSADQWNFISSEKNPADSCTRCITTVVDIMQLPWFIGPQWLCNDSESAVTPTQYPLIEPETDQEVRPLDVKITTCIHTAVTVSTPQPSLNTNRFERFSNWCDLITGIKCLQRFCRKLRLQKKPVTLSRSDEIQIAETFVLKQVQQENFSKDIKNLIAGNPLTKDSNIATFSPFLGEKGLLRLGGRINKATGIIHGKEINPIILPKQNHISCLLIRHIHEQVKHQGRIFTEGALRSAGYWVIGAKRMIASMIHKCVTCRKLRRNLETQKMADVPPDRITPGPVFTSVGIDVFGPWDVFTRKTRGGAANSKRWGLLFTCLTSRAAHIEVLEKMTSSSFINALRRFLAVRGPVKVIQSDRGSNFIGAAEEMKVNTVKVEEGLSRRKWDREQRNVKVDDVVLLRDPAEHRNCWPMGVIDRVFTSDDGLVRKVVVRTIRGDKPTFYIRPIHELVLLIESQ